MHVDHRTGDRSLFDRQGRRLYLTAEERKAFLGAAEKAERRTRTLCFCLAYTGCRISEALELTAERVDLEAGVIVFESLKKRRRGVYRAVPVPPAVLALDLVHGLREAQKGKDGGRQRPRLDADPLESQSGRGQERGYGFRFGPRLAFAHDPALVVDDADRRLFHRDVEAT